MRVRVIFSHFLPGINGIRNDKITIQDHSFTTLIAIIRIDLEGSDTLRHLEKFHDVNFGFLWRTRYRAKYEYRVLTWQKTPSADAVRLQRYLARLHNQIRQQL